jgi:iron complex outermembrane recepter protein
MTIRGAHRRRLRPIDIAVIISLALAASAAMAADQSSSANEDQSSSLNAVLISATPEVESAKTQAPTMTPLDVTQPTSVIGRYYIENNVPLSANYDTVISIAPSVQAVSPNGPGLMENQILSIRGFVDGQYNVTFDGIPWGDSNDFTHHTTSYFMAHDLGSVAVDRGPGTAATIGNATFGGTVAVQSTQPHAEAALDPYISYGSFDTQLYGAQFDTGKMGKYYDAAGFIDAESLSSNGYLTNMGQKRKNIFTKLVAPVDGLGVITFVATYNQVHQYVGLGATSAQIAMFGPNYGLSSDPTSQDYYGYNYDLIHTDFEYVGLDVRWGGGWSLNNKVYTYGYYHDGHNGEDPNGETPNGTVYSPTDVPGQHLVNYYRSWGDTLKVHDDLSFGDLQAGLWVDRQSNERGLFEIDETLNEAPNPAGLTGVDRLLSQVLTTVQPYFQFDWKPTDALTVSPGVRYEHFERNVDSVVNVKTGGAQSYADIYTATLPSLLVNYRLADNWSAYAQAAKGYLAPNENFFDYKFPGATSLAPQQSRNYQVGTSWQTRHLSLSGDVYYIDFNNLINSEKFGGDTIFFNQGGVTYKGVEAEATEYLGYGLSLYENGSVNSAKDKGSNLSNPGLWIPNAPNWTAAAGVIYNLHGFYASAVDKWVGRTYGDTGEQFPIGSYGVLSGALGYTFAPDATWLRNASVKLNVENLLNSNKIFALAGYTAAAGTPLWWTIPGRSVNVELSVPL